MTRRTKINIVNDMLNTIQRKGGKIKKTHLMYKANLSHKLLVTYLDELVSKGFIKEANENGTNLLVITDKGYDFLNHFKKLKEFQEIFGI